MWTIMLFLMFFSWSCSCFQALLLNQTWSVYHVWAVATVMRTTRRSPGHNSQRSRAKTAGKVITESEFHDLDWNAAKSEKWKRVYWWKRCISDLHVRHFKLVYMKIVECIREQTIYWQVQNSVIKSWFSRCSLKTTSKRGILCRS